MPAENLSNPGGSDAQIQFNSNNNAFSFAAPGNSTNVLFWFGGSAVYSLESSVGSTPGFTGNFNNQCFLSQRATTGDSNCLAMIDASDIYQVATGDDLESVNINAPMTVGGATANGDGTLTVANGVYLGSTAYTNPDYVFDGFYLDYRSPKRAEPSPDLSRKRAGEGYAGLKALGRVEAYVKAFHELPRMVDFGADGKAKPMDIFTRNDRVLEKVEESYLYLFDHERRIRRLELAFLALSLVVVVLGEMLFATQRRLRALEARCLQAR